MSRITATSCELSHDSRANDVIIMMAVLFCMVIVFVTLRLASKLMTGTFCTEDHIIMAAVIVTIVPVVAIFCGEFGPPFF